jgi:hypothetical protein
MTTMFDHHICCCHAMNCMCASLSRERAHQPRHIHSWHPHSENKEKDDVGATH